MRSCSRSIPDWKFAPDTVTAEAMHGALLIGPRHEIGANAAEWLRTLTSFEIELFCDDNSWTRATPLNVLEGPLSTIRYLMDLLARDPRQPAARRWRDRHRPER